MLLNLYRDRVDFRFFEDQGYLPSAPAGFMSRFRADYEAAFAPDRSAYYGAALGKKYDAALALLRDRTGREAANPFTIRQGLINQARDGRGDPLMIEAVKRATAEGAVGNFTRVQQLYREQVDSLLAKAHADGRGVPDPALFDREIAAKGTELRETSARKAQASVGFGAVGGFAGSAAGELQNPLQLLTMPLGGPVVGVGRSLLTRALLTAGSEALIAGGTQAGIEALDFQTRSRLGTPQTLEEALANIGVAALGAPIVGLGFRALATGGRGMLRLGRRFLPARDALTVMERAAFDAAARHGEAAADAAEAAQASARVAAAQPPSQPRMHPGRSLADPRDIVGSGLQFVDDAVAVPGRHTWLSYGKLPQWTLTLADRLGLRVGPDWTRTMDAGGVRKILKAHGDAAAEAARGQVPVTAADIARYPELVERHTEARLSKTNEGRDAISYLTIAEDGTVFVVEEARTGRGTLTLKDMWKWAPGKGPRGLDEMVGRSGAGAGADKVAGPSAPPTGEPTTAHPDPTQNVVLRSPGGKVFTPAGRAVEVEHQVVEASSLVTSHGPEMAVNPAFPAELQPRDRTRAASEAQITAMAGALEPERLAGGADAATGAPIIGPDGVVESGNGRTLAIRKAYADGTAERYRAHLKRLGYDVDRMKEPILVRQRVTGMTPEERIAFAREANEASTLAMGAGEQALADARRIPDSVLDLYEGGTVDLAKNRDFVRQLLRALPESERGAMMTADGSLSQAGLKRIEAALLAKAYGDPGLISKLTEATDNDIKAIGGALQDAAPGWAQMRARALAGELTPEVDATAHLLAAVRMVENARREGLPIGDLIAQGQMFGEGLTEAAHGFLRLFYRDGGLRKAAGRTSIAERLAGYLDEANKSLPGQNLFGEAPSGATDILRSQGDAGALARGKEVEATTTALAEPEIDQALETEVARILEASDIEVPLAEELVDGAPAAKTGSARDLMKAADARVKAAKEVQACAFGLAAE
jgi:hypothetical protein